MYDARFISNQIVTSFSTEAHAIDLKKINFLLYLVDGYHIASFGERIINNHIEAFRNGPGVRIICEEFRDFKETPIKALATYFDYEDMRRVIADPEVIVADRREFIVDVVTTWVGYEIGEIQDFVCAKGGPWWHTYHYFDAGPLVARRIPEEATLQYFTQTLIEPIRPHRVH